MKKRVGIFIITLCMCFGLFCPQVAVFAASGKTSVSASASSVNIGDTVTITGKASGASGEKVLTTMTLSWDAGVLQFVSCSVDSNGGGGSRVVNGDSFTITLKAISAGTSSISLSATDGVLFDTVESLDSMAGSSTSVTVNNAAGSTAGGNAGGSTSGENTAGGNAGGSTSGENTAGGSTGGSTSGENTAGGSAGAGKTLSGDNSLKSLTISPGTLSPSFSGSTTSYTAAVGSDVTSVAVSATPADDGAVVASVTGNDNLSEGTNTVKIVVKAENGVTATYTIKVTKQAQSASVPEDTAPKEDETETETEADTEDSRESITVNGAAYQIAEDFSKEDIPADFMEGTIHYHQNTYSGVSFMKGSLNLLWMVSQNAGDAETAKGKFFVYDEMRDSVYPFVRFSNGEKYVIALLAPVDFTMPENYQQTSFAVDEENTITAYQRITEDESEIESEFYIFYGVNHEGTEGWYQYDALEGTYQRLSVKITEEEKAEAGDELAVLQEEYDELLQQYKDAASFARTAMVVLCIVIGVLILIIVNLLVHRFRNRGNGGFMDDNFADDDFADDEEDDFPEHTPIDREFTLKNEIGGKSDAAVRMRAEMNRELDIAMRDRFGNDGDDNTENVREEEASQPLVMPEHEAADEKDDLEIIDFNDL